MSKVRHKEPPPNHQLEVTRSSNWCCSSSRMRFISMKMAHHPSRLYDANVIPTYHVKLAHSVPRYNLSNICICIYMPQGLLSHAVPNVTLCYEASA